MNGNPEELRFLAAIPKSNIAVRRVGLWFRDQDWSVVVRDGIVRPTGADPTPFGQDWDCEISKDHKRWFSVEVKWRELDWTCQEDFPHPTLNVDATRKKAADLYISINRDLSALALVKISSKPRWNPVKRPDRKKGYGVYELYEAQLSDVKWYQLGKTES